MNYLIWGATGQSKAVRAIIAGKPVVLVDRTPVQSWMPVTAPADLDAAIAEHRPEAFIVAIGGRLGEDRCELSDMLRGKGLRPLSAIHRAACVAESVSLGMGCQILMGACVSEEATLGDYCIINTNASVDHDCRLGKGVHVMPGATLAGEVVAGDYVTIGSNATVLPRVSIGAGAMIAAGAVVTKDVPAGETVYRRDTLSGEELERMTTSPV